MVYIYVLKCVNDKYYIGKTTNPNYRLESHFNSLGARWTTIHNPIELIELIPNCDKFDEDKYTIKYMETYGIDNVRGGSWTKENLNLDEKNVIKKMLNSANDKCYKCGEEGHFQADCYFNRNEQSQYSYSYNNPSYTYSNNPNNHQDRPRPRPRQNQTKNPVEDVAKELGNAFGTIFNQIDKVGNSFMEGFLQSLPNNH